MIIFFIYSFSQKGIEKLQDAKINKNELNKIRLRVIQEHPDIFLEIFKIVYKFQLPKLITLISVQKITNQIPSQKQIKKRKVH